MFAGQHVDRETRLKVELEQKKADLEKIQTEKELVMAKARLEAIYKLESEDSLAPDTDDYSLPASEDEDYVAKYVASLSPVKESHADSRPVVSFTRTACDSSGVIDPCVTSAPSATYASARGPQFADTLTKNIHQNVMSTRHIATNLNPLSREFEPVSTLPDMMPSAAGPIQSTWTSPACFSAATPSGPEPHANHDHVNMQSSQSVLGSPGQQNNVSQLHDLAKSFAEQVNLSRLPPPEPSIFSGDPLQYPTWNAAFETLIAKKGVPPEERIYYLKKYLGGEAKEAVEGYFLISSADAHKEAKELLKRRYGDQFVVANAFRSKLDEWKKIASRDGIALRKYADFLRQCEQP